MSEAAIRRAQLENLATLAAICVVILGLYAMGAGGFSAIGLALLLNINYFERSKPDSEKASS